MSLCGRLLLFIGLLGFLSLVQCKKEVSIYIREGMDDVMCAVRCLKEAAVGCLCQK